MLAWYTNKHGKHDGAFSLAKSVGPGNEDALYSVFIEAPCMVTYWTEGLLTTTQKLPAPVLKAARTSLRRGNTALANGEVCCFECGGDEGQLVTCEGCTKRAHSSCVCMVADVWWCSACKP